MPDKHICPACQNKYTSQGFCASCDDLAKNNGIDDRGYLYTLPADQRLTMHLPTAQDITTQLLSRMQAR